LAALCKSEESPICRASSEGRSILGEPIGGQESLTSISGLLLRKLDAELALNGGQMGDPRKGGLSQPADEHIFVRLFEKACRQEILSENLRMIQTELAKEQNAKAN